MQAIDKPLSLVSPQLPHSQEASIHQQHKHQALLQSFLMLATVANEIAPTLHQHLQTQRITSVNSRPHLGGGQRIPRQARHRLPAHPVPTAILRNRHKIVRQLRQRHRNKEQRYRYRHRQLHTPLRGLRPRSGKDTGRTVEPRRSFSVTTLDNRDKVHQNCSHSPH